MIPFYTSVQVECLCFLAPVSSVLGPEKDELLKKGYCGIALCTLYFKWFVKEMKWYETHYTQSKQHYHSKLCCGNFLADLRYTQHGNITLLGDSFIVMNGSSRGYLVLGWPILGLFCLREVVNGEFQSMFLEIFCYRYVSYLFLRKFV